MRWRFGKPLPAAASTGANWRKASHVNCEKNTAPSGGSKNLKDVQSEQDLRNIPLKHAGIKNLRWPVTLKDKEQGEQHTVAQVSMSVDLPHDLRGTHMSRFVEVLQQLGTLSPDNLEGVLDSLKEHLQAEKAFLELRFLILSASRLR
jgi:GTP cyclohydrolase FolE2